ncbi:MAG: non-homologous end-joining DNA ligase [Candidatus Aenigmarchaeota archaeon]|nr:non-homologous end-joining DNA ligase [Candidatus Aenigmarchaeota archaeon]
MNGASRSKFFGKIQEMAVFDGTRTIAYVDTEARDVKFLNRRMKFFQSNYPELQDMWKDVNAKQVILDGELVVFEKGKPNFYKLAEREHTGEKLRIKLLSEISPATYVVFDILHLDGQDLIDKPLVERKKILEKVVKESNRVLLSAYVIGKGKKFFQEVRKKNLEGVMAKRLQSQYQISKRSKDWLKIKYLKTLDCIIAGFTKGSGWREKYFGALILGCYHQGKLRYMGRCGTGLDEKGYAELTQKLQKIKTDKCPFEEIPKMPSGIIWVKPQLICEVRFMNLSRERIMRAPAFIRLREDKLPEECILEV